MNEGGLRGGDQRPMRKPMLAPKVSDGSDDDNNVKSTGIHTPSAVLHPSTTTTTASKNDKDTKKMKKKDNARQRRRKQQHAMNNATKDDQLPLEINVVYEDPPVFPMSIVNDTVQDFDPNLNAVVVTKIHGPPHVQGLRQMLCLLTHAYNQRSQRDIVVFTSEPIAESDVLELQRTAAPASLRVVLDNPGLHVMVDQLTPTQKHNVLTRCGVNTTSELSWYSTCTETHSSATLTERLAYNWQAEFRALHLWTHIVLQPYRYMMWMDSDAFCTRVWDQDPIAAMIRYDLRLLFDHFPQGAARGNEFPTLAHQVFGNNRTVCDVALINGTLVALEGNCLGKKGTRIRQVHGFFHVTDLTFFRSPKVMEWNRAMIGDTKFMRLFDDQIGITIPAAVLAGPQSREMKSLGIRLRVMHNYVLDGMMSDWRGYFVPWWQLNANTTFPEASNKCVVDISA